MTAPAKWPLLYWGHTALKWVYENRVEYPLKRIDWNPDGKRHPENRGKSGYQMISRDETFDILTKGLNRVRGTYDPSSFLAGFPAHPQWVSLPYWFSDYFRLEYTGGHDAGYSPISWGGWYSGATSLTGYIETYVLSVCF